MGSVLSLAAEVDRSAAARVTGQSSARLRALSAAGLLSAGAPTRFCLEDLSVIRRLRRIPTRSLPVVRNNLIGSPAALTVSYVGASLMIRDEVGVFDVRTGQAVFDFAILVEDRSDLSPTKRRSATATNSSEVDQLEVAIEVEKSSPSTARALYLSALTKQPDHIEANMNLARLEATAGELDAAERRYRHVLTLTSYSSAAFALGEVLEKQDRCTEARDAYLAAVATDPHHIGAHNRLAHIYRRSGQPFLALKHQRCARKLTQAS